MPGPNSISADHEKATAASPVESEAPALEFGQKGGAPGGNLAAQPRTLTKASPKTFDLSENASAARRQHDVASLDLAQPKRKASLSTAQLGKSRDLVGHYDLAPVKSRDEVLIDRFERNPNTQGLLKRPAVQDDNATDKVANRLKTLSLKELKQVLDHPSLRNIDLSKNDPETTFKRTIKGMAHTEYLLSASKESHAGRMPEFTQEKLMSHLDAAVELHTVPWLKSNAIRLRLLETHEPDKVKADLTMAGHTGASPAKMLAVFDVADKKDKLEPDLHRPINMVMNFFGVMSIAQNFQ